METHSLPLWDPLPTKYTFIHFEEDLLQKAWLGRSVTCPGAFLPAALVLENAKRTPASASDAGRRGLSSPGKATPTKLLSAKAVAAATRGKLAAAKAVASAPVEARVTCRNGHDLQRLVHIGDEPGSNFCDGGCGRENIKPPEHLYRCEMCDYDLCQACYHSPKAHAGVFLKSSFGLPLVEAQVPAKKLETASTSPVENPVRGGAGPATPSAAGRRDPVADSGAWHVVRPSRSTNGGHRGIPPVSAAAPEAATEAADSARWANGRDNQVSRDRDAASTKRSAGTGHQGKDRQKWDVGQTGGQHSWGELVEEEDVHTDATGSTGPGGEEVTSGASTSGKEQGSRAASAQPLKRPELTVREAEPEAGADGEAEDGPTLDDDGWSVVPKARKRERKEPARRPATEASTPQAALVSTLPRCPPPPQRREGAVAKRSAEPPSTGPENGRSGEGAEGEASGGDTPSNHVSGSRPRTHAPAGFSRSGSNDEPKEAAAPRGLRTMLRFKIGIKQEEDFNVMRKLLVPGGGHIKRVAQLSGAKVTVRGEGSGHHEDDPQAALEPINICIQSAYASSLDKARFAVEDLLQKLHEEYRGYCRRYNLPKPDLKILPGERTNW